MHRYLYLESIPFQKVLQLKNVQRHSFATTYSQNTVPALVSPFPPTTLRDSTPQPLPESHPPLEFLAGRHDMNAIGELLLEELLHEVDEKRHEPARRVDDTDLGRSHRHGVLRDFAEPPDQPGVEGADGAKVHNVEDALALHLFRTQHRLLHGVPQRPRHGVHLAVPGLAGGVDDGDAPGGATRTYPARSAARSASPDRAAACVSGP